MRWVFISLLLINVGIAAWFMLGEKTPEPMVQGLPEEHGMRLSLLHELKDGQLEVRLINPVAELSAAKCLMVGPFNNHTKGEDARDRLAAWDVPAELKDVEVSDGPGFWVHLVPEMSRKAAIQKLRELQTKKIDSYVIPKGDLENGISFGVFVGRERAEMLQKTVLAEGYPAKMLEIDRTRIERWLVIEAEYAQIVDDSMWKRLKDVQESIERRQGYCPGVAQKGKFH